MEDRLHLNIYLPNQTYFVFFTIENKEGMIGETGEPMGHNAHISQPVPQKILTTFIPPPPPQIIRNPYYDPT